MSAKDGAVQPAREVLMRMELADQEAELIKLLLVKEIEETRVELHHAKNIDFKAGLEGRQESLRAILGKLSHPE